MSSPRYSVSLENGRYARVVEWKGEARIDLREWEDKDQTLKATKKGISLNLLQFKTSTDVLKCYVDESLKKNEEFVWHLGSNVFVTVRKVNPCVDIRLYWKPPNQTETVPTKKGLCLRPVEYSRFKEHIDEMTKHLPDLNTVVPCYFREDHMNQLGMLRCKSCNPDEYYNW